MNLLILGGTAMVGRAVASEAVARGHEVTCFARGSAAASPGATLVRGDREVGLAPLMGRAWDAVVDVSRHPGQVRRAVRDLDAGHWVFVSTANVYADVARPARDEDTPLLPPLEGDVMESMDDYGAAKVACEDAVRAAASATIVRPGLIGGPGDASGRSGYWPWRLAHPSGPEVIAPDDPDLPCALIDVRDLASWLVTCAERRLVGTFNADGEATTLGEVLAASARVADARVPLRLVAPARLVELGVAAWMGPRSLPLWVDDPEWRQFAVLDTTRARASGLTCRPLEETLAAALAYENTRTEPRRAGLTDAEEREFAALI